MSEIHPSALDDVRLLVWLRVVGIAAILAAALGSVLFATPAVPGFSTGSTTCTADLGGSWAFRNCDRPAEVSAP